MFITEVLCITKEKTVKAEYALFSYKKPIFYYSLLGVSILYLITCTLAFMLLKCFSQAPLCRRVPIFQICADDAKLKIWNISRWGWGYLKPCFLYKKIRLSFLTDIVTHSSFSRKFHELQSVKQCSGKTKKTFTISKAKISNPSLPLNLCCESNKGKKSKTAHVLATRNID